ncbi:hypothetical protein KEM52_001593 [Ascosphaera acerosa]|nr:hypothetical protein KEM52_001593 [Ascosphaera acerosa]
MRFSTLLTALAAASASAMGKIVPDLEKQDWNSQACTLKLLYQGPDDTAGTNSSYLSLVVRSPSFRLFAFHTMGDVKEWDFSSRYLPQGKLHVHKGANISDFYFGYDEQVVRAPLRAAESPQFGRSNCVSAPANLWECDINFNCTGTDAIMAKETKQGKVYQRRAAHEHGHDGFH